MKVAISCTLQATVFKITV